MTREKASQRLFFCLFFAYTMSCFGKIAFSAVTAALIKEAILTKTQAGIISGAFWLFYAIGQFIGGVVANKSSPVLLINIGLVCATVCNLFMAVSDNYIAMLIIWTICGFAQFGFWPAILKLMTTNIIEEHRAKSFRYLSFSYCLGSIISHLCTAVVLLILPWNYVFICCAFMSFISVFAMLYAKDKLIPHLSDDIKITASNNNTVKHSVNAVLRIIIVLFCMMSFMRALTETGIKNWIPTIMMEIYGASPSYTSFLSVLILALNLIGVTFVNHIYKRTRENESVTLNIVYFTVFPLMLTLLNLQSMNIYLTTAITALITLMFYGSGHVISTYFPAKLQNYGLTSVLGGIFNCFAALGNVVGTYGNGLIADLYGWNIIIYIWNAIIVLFVLITLILLSLWKKFSNDKNKT